MAKAKKTATNTKTKAPEKEPAKKAKAKADAAPKPEPTQEAPAPEASPAAPEAKAKQFAGYLGRHIAGSRKEAVHKVFDEKGRDEAIAHAVSLGIKEGSAKSWAGHWQREAKVAEVAKAKKA